MIFTNTYQYTKYHPALSSLLQVDNLMKSAGDNTYEQRPGKLTNSFVTSDRVRGTNKSQS